MTTTLPVFSLRALEQAVFSDSWPDDEVALRARLLTALQEEGFFYLSEHGVSDATLSELQRVTHAVMDESPPEMVGNFGEEGLPRGLTPLNGESVAKVMGKGNEGDLCEKWCVLSHPKATPNVWPSPEFRAAWEEYQHSMTGAARRLLSVIGRVLKLDTSANWPELMDGEYVMRHLRYPDASEERCIGESMADDSDSIRVRMHEHNDLDIITLLHQTPCENGFVSLQALVRDEWTNVPAIPGTLVVNFGEVLSWLTGGSIRATKHRVLAPPTSLRLGSARNSTVCFYQPHADFRMRPLASSDFNAYFAGESDRPFKEWFANVISEFTGANQQAAVPVA